MSYIKGFWKITKESFVGWRNDNAILLSAALSYYTLFSLAPILLIIILIFGFLFLITFIIDTGLVGFGEFLNQFLPHKIFIYFWESVNFLFSVTFMSIMFAIIFKVLPEAKVSWRDVWPGAVLTAFLFAIGKLLISLYLGNSRIGAIFGGASSLIVILIWVYYSAQMLFFGAEFTRNYAFKFGSYKNKEKKNNERKI